MSSLINSNLDAIDDIQDKIKSDADEILTLFDIEEFLNDQEGYLTAMSQAFLQDHLDDVENGIAAGEKMANAML